jgi:glucuronate isomerase
MSNIEAYLNDFNVDELIFDEIKDLGIIDYHNHLDPKEIYLDKPFENIGEMLLKTDHYKWRLMRAYGVDEKYITGSETTYKEKFEKFAEVVSTAYGNPIKKWLELELYTFFKIKTPLSKKTATRVWARANKYIKENRLSPRKCLKLTNVEYVATTDDVCDSLEYHAKIDDPDILVTPTFRTDMLMEFKDSSYLEKLENVSGVQIGGISSLEKALNERIRFFKSHKCSFSDIGIEHFPRRIATREEADLTIKKILAGEAIDSNAREGLQGYLYVFLGRAYYDNNIIMQIHIGALRNPNTRALETIGRDAGFDSVGDVIPIRALADILDQMGEKRPKAIIYTLNPAMYYPLITLCGSFPGCMPGIAWWFNDHERGIKEYLQAVSELSHIGVIPGMLTDSRSFLSFSRHTYFREILAEYLSSFYYDGEVNFDYYDIIKIAKDISYYNIKNLIGLK